MDDRPKRLADYFLVVGLGDKAEICSESESVDCTDLPYSTCDPITELAIMHKGDKVPERFKIINETTNGQSANLNAGNILSVPIFLCYSRKSRSTDEHPLPLQPICSIRCDKLIVTCNKYLWRVCQACDMVLKQGVSLFVINLPVCLKFIDKLNVYYPDRSQPIAEGHQVIEKTIGGAQADLNLFGRIKTYLTFKRGLLYGHTPAITDLAIIGKDQSPPPGFKKLNMNLNKGIGPSLYICYKMALVKPPSVSYKASVLSRYPKTDYEDFPLPESSPLFCLPLGVCVEHWDTSGQFPLPTFSTFILTNSVGAKMYGSAVTFYEQINSTHESLPQMRKDLGVKDFGVKDKGPLYMSKCICMLSRWPFFSAFKVFLSSLYRISLSPGTTLPIERYILNLMSDVPFPSISRPRVMMEIGSEQLIFTLPVKTPLPISISNHWSLVNSLDANNCVTLFSLLLMEQKVILHSSRPSLLTCVGEALTSVLFPFQWQCPYIPMCPLALSVYTQAPMSFIIGIDSRYFDHYEKPDDVCVVDLDCNMISIPNEIKKFIADRPLPLKAQKLLRKELKAIATKLQCMMVDSDLAVELAPLDYAEIESRNSLDQIDINVREVFLRFNGIVFGNYPSCLSARVDSVAESAREAKNLFNQNKFLKMCAPIDHAFYKAVFNTQMFINFVEQRSFSYSADTTIAFFDECTEKLSRDYQAKLIKPLAESQRQPDVTIVAAPPHGIGLEHDKKYSYDGFPVLDHNLFLTPESQQPTSPNTDNIKNDSSSMITVRSTAEKTKGKQTAEVAHGNPELWAKTLLAEIYCLWFIHFPGFLTSDWNKMHHLDKAFNVLEDMHKSGAIPNDEVCYRVLMEQCVKLWKPFMAVKVFSEMQKVGVKPNAVTYGIYNRALIDCNCPGSVKSRWRAVVVVICTCLYLRKKVAPKDAFDGVRMRMARRNSYDEAIGEFFPSQRRDSMSSTSSKGNGSPKLVHSKRSRSTSISKKVLPQFGREGSKKKTKKREQQESEVEARTTEEKKTETEKDEGYTVKRGNISDQNKSSQNATTDSPDTSERRNYSYSFSKASNLRRPLSKVSRTSVYSRKFDTMMSNSRSSSRMAHSHPSSAGSNDLNINISSCTECNNCHRFVYDEDIMSNWSALDSDYNTQCPYCSHPFVAQLVIQLQHHHQTHSKPAVLPHTPVVTTKVSKIPEEESSPTPPARRKRDKPIKIKRNSKSSRESTPSDSPKNIKQDSLSSTDSSPLQNKMEVTSSSESNPLVSKVTKQEVTSSSENSPLVNKVTKQEVTSSDDTSVKDDTKIKEKLFASHLGTKDKVSPKPSGNGPLINVTDSFADEIIKQFDTKATTSDYYSSTDLQGSEDTGPPAAVVVPTVTDDTTDTGSSVVAMMKSRGHARTHSAPLVLDEEQPSSDKIAVTTVDIVTSSNDQNKDSVKRKDDKESKEDRVPPPIVVHYLGPLVLRKEIESLLIREGLSYLERKDFPIISPTVFWNLVWYFTRLGLSSYLPRQALVPFSDFIENKQRNLTINLLWDCITNVSDDNDPPLYKQWKDKVAQMLYPTDVTESRKKSDSRLQSFAARLQCWNLLPVAVVILGDRKPEGDTNTSGPQRGLYHDLALFCSYLREGSLDIERFHQAYHEMLQQLPKHLQTVLRKEDELPSFNSNMCQLFFNTLYVV